jgi:cytochrome P450
MAAPLEMGAEAPPVLDIDPFVPEYLENPTRFHAVLREAGRIVYVPKHEMYATGRYVEVQSSFSDWKNFSSAAGTGLGHVQKGLALRTPGPIVEVDPPDHTKMRTTLNRILSPAVIRGWRDQFEAEAERLVAALVPKGEFDAVTELVEPFILKVLPDAMGLDDEGREHLLPIGDLTGNALGPRNDLFLDSERKVAPLMPWFNSKFERAAMLAGGFGEKIWQASDTGEIESEKVMPLIRTFLRGGTDTGISGISSMLWLMASNQDQWSLLKAEPKLARQAFDEALRLETPAQSLFRTTRGSFEFAGYQLEDDVKVMCCLAAANRDPAKWADADKYDIKRSTLGHVAFGTGIHVCIGQMVARLEGEAILGALLRHTEVLAMNGPQAHKLSNTARRLVSLPLRVKSKAT